MDATTHDAHAPMEYRTLVAVWGALLVLTALLVGVNAAGHDANWSIVATLLIAPLKAGLVLYYFMHLKYESNAIKAMVFVVLGTLVIFIGLLFLDYSFR